jgi:hypothetical protein
MSYEGYEVWLCRNGHQHRRDALQVLEMSLGEWKCPDCGASLAWYTCVDETNGQDPETGKCPGEVDLEIDKPAVTETCPTCKYTHRIAPETYKIPPKGIGLHAIEGDYAAIARFARKFRDQEQVRQFKTREELEDWLHGEEAQYAKVGAYCHVYKLVNGWEENMTPIE